MLEDMPHDGGTSALPPPRNAGGPYRICCVCLGNICRSPMAEVILRERVSRAGLGDRVVVDSAGTGDWHVGDRMHSGARAELARGGYDGAAHRARRFDPSWLSGCDLVLAMDASNLRNLRAQAPAAEAGRIRLFGEIAGLGGRDVPDPYGGPAADFAGVRALLESGMSRLVAQLSAMPAAGGQPAEPEGPGGPEGPA
jgi:low molecular weight protein-tyrosine phosphatase